MPLVMQSKKKMLFFNNKQCKKIFLNFYFYLQFKERKIHFKTLECLLLLLLLLSLLNRGMTVEAARKIGKRGEPWYICN